MSKTSTTCVQCDRSVNIDRHGLCDICALFADKRYDMRHTVDTRDQIEKLDSDILAMTKANWDEEARQSRLRIAEGY